MTYCFQFSVVYFWTVQSKVSPAISWLATCNHVVGHDASAPAMGGVSGTLSKMDLYIHFNCCVLLPVLTGNRNEYVRPPGNFVLKLMLLTLKEIGNLYMYI